MFRNKLILGVGTAVALGCGLGVLANPAQANADTVTSTGIEHTVVQGDTLWGLSQKYGVSLQDVFNSNNKSETNSLLQIGDQIFIPNAKTVQTTTATTQRTNTSVTGDTSSASTEATTASTFTSTASSTSSTSTGSTASSSSVATSVAQSSSTTSSSSVAQSSSTTVASSSQTIQEASASTNTNSSTASSSTSTATTGGSVYSQFIAAGGTPSLWSSVVIPESGGDPNASNGKYHGLGQTAESWGQGSVASQTKGMINYAVSRYGSVSNAISFRAKHGWW